MRPVRYITARAPGQTRRDLRDGIEIIRLGGRFTVYPLVLAWLLPRRRSFDAVIDCQNGIPFFTPLVLPRGVPVLCVIHHVHDAQFGMYFPPVAAAIGRLLEGPAARWCYRRQEWVTASNSTAVAIRSRLRWSGPVRMVPNGLPAESFSRPVVTGSRPDSTATGKGSLVWVGRLVAHKRAGRLLDIADRLRDTGISIDVIGRGPATDSLMREIASRGLESVVRLRGYLPEDEKRAMVADALLHLSTSRGEGWGLCVLEAAALGVPTVAYDVDGLRDAVRDGESGWLVRDGELIADVTERALKELASPSRRAELAAACRAWAERFDWDQSAAAMAALVDHALRRWPGEMRRAPGANRRPGRGA